MTADISDAFAHPVARSVSTAAHEIADRISLRDYIVDVEIGAFQAERDMTQRISFNVVVELLANDVPIEDDVDRILSYDRVTEAISYELAAERLNLLETLAKRVADRILREPQAVRVFVRIEKLDRGAGKLGVEIVRARQAGSSKDAPTDVLAPTIGFLSNAALNAPNVTEILDQLAKGACALILCVDQMETGPRSSDNETSQQRMALLAIEQNAWQLVARDPRCAVVGTETELDWAMRNGKVSVWAPSKIVLDAVDGPNAAQLDALGLAIWFAKRMNAVELVTIGADAPSAGGLSTRTLPNAC